MKTLKRVFLAFIALTIATASIFTLDLNVEGSGKVANAAENTEAATFVTNLEVTPTSKTIAIGETVTIKTTINGCKFTSSDPNVALVSTSGIVTGLGEGTATIIVTSPDGQSQEITISVTPDEYVPVTETTAEPIFTITPSYISVNLGEQADTKIEATGDVAIKNFTVIDDTVATVSTSGVVTGLKLGETKVIVTGKDGSTRNVTIYVVESVEYFEIATEEITEVATTEATTAPVTTTTTTIATRTTTSTAKTTIKATAATQYFFSAEADWSRFDVRDSNDNIVTGVEFKYNDRIVASPKDIFVKSTHKYALDMYKDGAKIGTATAYIGVKGDCSLDDEVNSIDSVKVLQAYASMLVKMSYSFNSDANFNTLAMFLADIDTETAGISKLNSIDAVYILKYFARNIAKLNPTWSNLVPDLKGKNY
jgi:uncharacterized protein YjdB